MKIKLLKICVLVALISFQCAVQSSTRIDNEKLVLESIISEIIDGSLSPKYFSEHIGMICESDRIFDVYFNAIKYNRYNILNVALGNCFSVDSETGKTYKLAKYAYNTNDIVGTSVFIINEAFHFSSEDARIRVFAFIYQKYLASKSQSPWVKSALSKFLDEGLDPNFLITATTTPVNLAILYNNTEMFELVLRYGASANQLEGAIDSPIEYALSKEARESQKYYVTLLVKHGFDIEKNWHLLSGSKIRLDEYAKSMYEIENKYCLILDQYDCPEGK